MVINSRGNNSVSHFGRRCGTAMQLRVPRPASHFRIFLVLVLISNLLGYGAAQAQLGSGYAQPRIALRQGFVDIYSQSSDYVSQSDVVDGREYSLDIHMDQTDRYDYLIQQCSYNNKYNFIDANSCLVCDNNFRRKWENDEYYYMGGSKRTVVHFLAPEPLTNIQCRIAVIECCGCAERACERNVLLPAMGQYQQRTIYVNLIEDSTNIAFYSPSAWPWWLWLIIALLLLLLLCLFCVPLLLFCLNRRGFHKGNAAKTAVNENHLQNQQQTIITKEGDVSVLPGPGGFTQRTTQEKISTDQRKHRTAFRTASESPSESARSAISQSRNALMIRQEQAERKLREHGIQKGVATATVFTTDPDSRHADRRQEQDTRFRQDESREHETRRHETHGVSDRSAAEYGYNIGSSGAVDPNGQMRSQAADSSQHYIQNSRASASGHVEREFGQSEQLGNDFRQTESGMNRSRSSQQAGTTFASSIGATGSGAGHRQRSTSRERFYQKNDHEQGLVEEGYDKAHFTFTTKKDVLV